MKNIVQVRSRVKVKTKRVITVVKTGTMTPVFMRITNGKTTPSPSSHRGRGSPDPRDHDENEKAE